MALLSAILVEFFKMLQMCKSSQLGQWLLGALALSHTLSSSGWPENYQLKDGERFDFIVVGSGSAGAIVAARLSEVPYFNVLLIEAGGDPPPTSVIPGLFPTLHHTEYDWDYKAKLDKGIGETHSDGTIYYARGKVLGGSSSTNYLIYSRGVPQDYDEWDQVAPGWDWNTVLHYFKKSEGMTDNSVFTNPEHANLHSTEGPVKISRPEQDPMTEKINEIRLNLYGEIGIKRILENNGPEMYGAARPHFIFGNGRRSSTAEAYLRPNIHRNNLRVAKHALVTKVLIDPITKIAYGVRVIVNNKEITIYANKEIILSAGTMNSPKILMLSGVGPKEELSKLGINCLVDLPVGKNLHDHQITPLFIKGSQTITSASQNLLAVTRLGAMPVPIQTGHFAIHDNSGFPPLKPQIQFFNTYVGAGASVLIGFACKTISFYNTPYCISTSKANTFNEIDSVLVILLHPLSRGQVTLRSADPLDDPIIELGYYRNERDLNVTTEGVKIMARLVNTSYFRKVGGEMVNSIVSGCEGLRPGSDEYWRCYTKSTVATIMHAVGTCKMGVDGVVNERLTVHNVHGLRVIDASIMPQIPSGNTNAPTMMIGEKGADMIKEDHGLFSPF